MNPKMIQDYLKTQKKNEIVTESQIQVESEAAAAGIINEVQTSWER